MPGLALIAILGAVAVASAAVVSHESPTVAVSASRQASQTVHAHRSSEAKRARYTSASGASSGLDERWVRSVAARRRALLADAAAAPSADADTASNPLPTPTHPDVGLDSIFVPRNLSCDPKCTERGNCNAEEGTCECPFGYTGPTCDLPLMPACQVRACV
ncbi:hypothetical protein CHLRE_14g632823v5 [Chlamydomonas reinhardtii]|uniref:EGF-like domain-containing protein n=1 Tax=Chlamydomonas reinhardtii TaxID=3055 RepID=A0A2K3CYV9_CHLRE|nr:uncharacterized protein CHLRE_14g632823v5 [Chlamydomonas reinhardtii]PNW73463.1 hypothetical protein CHLRE_14g632823v5 [Chlamydomonas reinhardtii]